MTARKTAWRVLVWISVLGYLICIAINPRYLSRRGQDFVSAVIQLGIVVILVIVLYRPYAFGRASASATPRLLRWTMLAFMLALVTWILVGGGGQRGLYEMYFQPLTVGSVLQLAVLALAGVVTVREALWPAKPPDNQISGDDKSKG